MAPVNSGSNSGNTGGGTGDGNAPQNGSDNNPQNRNPDGSWQKPVTNIAYGTAGIGGILLTIYGAIMIIPKAIGQAFFPWLPQEFQGPAISVCSCSSCLCSGIILILMVASKFS